MEIAVNTMAKDIYDEELSKLLFFDIETPNKKNDSICSLGIAAQNACGEIELQKRYLVNPESKFDDLSINIQGITANDIKNAPTFIELWNLELRELFDSHVLVAHNAPPALGILRRTLLRYNVEPTSRKFIDTLPIARRLYKNLESYSLDALCGYLNIEHLEHHDVLGNAIACRNLLKDMEPRFSNSETQWQASGAYRAQKRIPSPIETALDDLYGILIGMSIEKKTLLDKTDALLEWMKSNGFHQRSLPELLSKISQYVEGNGIEKERQVMFSEIQKKVRELLKNADYDTAQLSRIFIGVTRGIKANEAISFKEAECLQRWLLNNNDAFNEIAFTKLFHELNDAVYDGWIDTHEEKELLALLSEIASSAKHTEEIYSF